MPIVKDFRTTKIIKLKTLEGGEVEIYNGILFRDSKYVNDLQKNQQDPDKLLKVLSIAIKSWNFTNEKGEDLSINEDTIGILSPETISEISNELTNFINEKKNS